MIWLPSFGCGQKHGFGKVAVFSSIITVLWLALIVLINTIKGKPLNISRKYILGGQQRIVSQLYDPVQLCQMSVLQVTPTCQDQDNFGVHGAWNIQWGLLFLLGHYGPQKWTSTNSQWITDREVEREVNRSHTFKTASNLFASENSVVITLSKWGRSLQRGSADILIIHKIQPN